LKVGRGGEHGVTNRKEKIENEKQREKRELINGREEVGDEVGEIELRDIEVESYFEQGPESKGAG